jgi:hypothetical protein
LAGPPGPPVPPNGPPVPPNGPPVPPRLEAYNQRVIAEYLARQAAQAAPPLITYTALRHVVVEYTGKHGNKEIADFEYGFARRCHQMRHVGYEATREEFVDCVHRDVEKWFAGEEYRRKQYFETTGEDFRITTINDIFDVLRLNYGNGNDEDEALAQYQGTALVYLKGETIDEYFIRAEALCERLNPVYCSWSDFVERMLSNLRGPFRELTHKVSRRHAKYRTAHFGQPMMMHNLRGLFNEVHRELHPAGTTATATSTAASAAAAGTSATQTEVIERLRQQVESLKARNKDSRKLNAARVSAPPASIPTPTAGGPNPPPTGSGPPGKYYTDEEFEKIKRKGCCCRCGEMGHRSFNCEKPRVNLRPLLGNW